MTKADAMEFREKLARAVHDAWRKRVGSEMTWEMLLRHHKENMLADADASIVFIAASMLKGVDST